MLEIRLVGYSNRKKVSMEGANCCTGPKRVWSGVIEIRNASDNKLK